MNKRLKKKFEKNRRRNIHRILDMVLDINGLGKRRRATTGFLPTAFMEFFGHVAQISVRVHEHGWIPGEYPDEVFAMYTDEPDNIDRMTRKMKQYHTLLMAETPAGGAAGES